MSCWDEEWDWGGRSASVGSSAELNCSLHTPDAIFRAGLSCRVEHCCISCNLSSQKMPRFRPQNIAAGKRREGERPQAAPAPGQLLPAWRAALLSPFPALPALPGKSPWGFTPLPGDFGDTMALHIRQSLGHVSCLGHLKVISECTEAGFPQPQSSLGCCIPGDPFGQVWGSLHC